MTAVGKDQMEDWKNNQQRVIVCSQSGEKKKGRLVDYDDTEIVLEEGERDNAWNPIKRVICRNWFCVQEAPPASCHD